MFVAKMKKDSAQWIINSLYSIIFSFVSASLLFFKEDVFLFNDIHFITWILLIYFLIDWLTYNTKLDVNNEQQHFEILITIIFIITYGWIIVLSKNIDYSNEFIKNPHYKNFFIAFGLYLFATTLLALIDSFIEDFKGKSEKFTFSLIFKFRINLLEVLDLIGRLIVSAFLFFENINNDIKILLWMVVGITLTKFIRYEFVWLKRKKEIDKIKTSRCYDLLCEERKKNKKGKKEN